VILAFCLGLLLGPATEPVALVRTGFEGQQDMIVSGSYGLALHQLKLSPGTHSTASKPPWLTAEPTTGTSPDLQPALCAPPARPSPLLRPLVVVKSTPRLSSRLTRGAIGHSMFVCQSDAAKMAFPNHSHCPNHQLPRGPSLDQQEASNKRPKQLLLLSRDSETQCGWSERARMSIK
jgi:hypothetical protein